MSKGRDAARELYVNQGRDFTALKERLRGRVATVASLAGGKVEIREAGASAGAGEYLARTPGVKLSIGDPVVVINVGGRLFVLPHQDAAPTVTELEAPLALASLDDGGAADGQILTWNATSGAWEPSSALAPAAISFAGSAPTLAKQAAAGSTATLTGAGHDSAYGFTLTPGGTGIAAGKIIAVSFGAARSDANGYNVHFCARNSGAAGVAFYTTNRTDAGFDINVAGALTSGTAYNVGYTVVGF